MHLAKIACKYSVIEELKTLEFYVTKNQGLSDKIIFILVSLFSFCSFFSYIIPFFFNKHLKELFPNQSIIY
mgnify:CR=1 FL=1